jgi:predicted ABC-type ATPase
MLPPPVAFIGTVSIYLEPDPLKINDWQKHGYKVVLIYFWLNSPKLATERVKDRVKKGGHSVPSNVIKRRYFKGVRNLFEKYMPICDYWLVIDNSKEEPELISEGKKGLEIEVFNKQIWKEIKSIYNEAK